jgi:hypothetical protein
VTSRSVAAFSWLITLSLVVFGQVCAMRELVVGPSLTVVSEQKAADSSVKNDRCTHEGCADEGEADEGCASSLCCSSWAPPGSRLSLPPPASVRVPPSDVWVAPISLDDDDRALEVARSELARPPGMLSDPLIDSPRSRRGPPALL